MQQVFSIPKSMKKDFKYTFCPGCDHGIAIRILCEVLDELGIQDKSICATSIGCSVFLYDFINVDCIEAPHGRALAEATGVKRACPDKVVFTYQGDGDFASIGLAESMHAAFRGERVTALKQLLLWEETENTTDIRQEWQNSLHLQTVVLILLVLHWIQSNI